MGASQGGSLNAVGFSDAIANNKLPS